MLATGLIRVAIIEGQFLFGKALALLVGQDPSIEVVCDLQEVVASTLTELNPDIVIFDLESISADFPAAIALTRSSCPTARVCVLTGRMQPEALQRCMGSGADGYVLKDVSPAELTRAIKAVAEGSSYVDPRVAGNLLRRRGGHNRATNGSQELSQRESEVVKLIAEGLANKEIGVRLSLSEKTVKNYISRIFSKLNISARTQAAVFAIRSGII
jgi:DNA-binding NarL/FixJ family response regulator